MKLLNLVKKSIIMLSVTPFLSIAMLSAAQMDAPQGVHSTSGGVTNPSIDPSSVRKDPSGTKDFKETLKNTDMEHRTKVDSHEKTNPTVKTEGKYVSPGVDPIAPSTPVAPSVPK